MKKYLLKRVLPILLALALLLTAAPHAAVRAEASPGGDTEAKTARKDEKSAARKASLPERPEGDGGYLDFDEDEVLDLALEKELELSFSEDQWYIYLRFVPESAGLYDLVSIGDIDVYVNLLDADGGYLSGDDDSGEGLNFSISAPLSVGGTYYYQIGRYDMEAVGKSFSVLMTRKDFEPMDLELDNELDLVFDEDQTDIWLRFVPAVSRQYRIESSGTMDVYVRLMNQIGNTLGMNDDGGYNGNFRLTEYLYADEVYYFDVKYYPTDEAEDLRFSVLLTEYDPVTSGPCGADGDNLVWSYDMETGTLTIEGKGAMKDFVELSVAPWDEFCAGIQAVELPDGLTNIGENAFCYCTNLRGISIPEGVERIGANAFLYCYNMNRAELPTSLTVIDSGAFCYCPCLSELTIPEHVTYIGSHAFEYCSFSEITIPAGVTEIFPATFYNCIHLAAVTIPDGVTQIGAYAFQNCDELSAVTLPDSLISVGEYAFCNCPLTSVELPAGIEKIGAGAFTGSDAGRLVIRRADCVVGYLEEGVDPDETDEDLEHLLTKSSLGSFDTEIYGRHDQDKLDNDPLDDHYRYAEAYAAAYGYSFFDLYAFSDVKEYSWYEIPVAWASGMGITSGTGNGKFSPKASCLREQVMTFLWAAAGKPEPTLTENPFTDVNPSKYYAKAVLWAYENGITTGATATTFGVGKVCNRAQVVTFLYGAAGRPEPTAEINPFTDVKETDYFYQAVLWAVENGITGGTTPTTFSPKQTCTRSQVVTFLYAAAHLPLANRGDDDEIYEDVFYSYSELMEEARNAATTDERYLLCAQAEAMLLGESVMIPTTTTGGGYAMSRIAPHTTPQVRWSEENSRLSGLVISDEFLTPDERGELDALWKAAVAGEGTYDPAAYLTGRGHSLLSGYAAPSGDVSTLDWLAASLANEIEVLVNVVDGLTRYDELGDLQPALAESWEVSADGLTWTFHIRDGVYWYTSEGEAWAELTANDFVAGFHHMLDSFSGRVSLAGEGYAEIRGVDEYLWENGSFENVGCKATDEHTLVYTLNKPVPYFMTLLSYNIFLPLCDSFFRSRGGVYGIAEYQLTVENGSCEFGLPDDASSQVYCGPFLMRSAESSGMQAVKNPNYYRADAVTLDTLSWVFGDWYVDEIYDKAVSGDYVSVELSESNGLLDRAKADGNFYNYAYTTDTDTVTYFSVLNLNRGTYSLEDGGCASGKNEAQKSDTAKALLNYYFRNALAHAIDRTSWNAVTRGDELAETNLRNMLTPPDFVKLTNPVTDMEGHSFPAGTFYGEMVQYYCDLYGFDVYCADGVDGWYSPFNARANLEIAKEELGGRVEWPIQIDLVYRGDYDPHYEQALAWKESVEETLGAENVTVNLIEAKDMTEWSQSCFYFDTGAEANYDVNEYLGWGPDYGDPMTYLNIFDRETDGYILKFCGLY